MKVFSLVMIAVVMPSISFAGSKSPFAWENNSAQKSACESSILNEVKSTMSMNGMETKEEIAKKDATLLSNALSIEGTKVADIALLPSCAAHLSASNPGRVSFKCSCTMGVDGLEQDVIESHGNERITRVNDFLLSRAPRYDDTTVTLIRDIITNPVYNQALAASMKASGCDELKLATETMKFLVSKHPMLGEGDDFFGGEARDTFAVTCQNEAIVGLKIQQQYGKDRSFKLKVTPLLVR